MVVLTLLDGITDPGAGGLTYPGVRCIKGF